MASGWMASALDRFSCFSLGWLQLLQLWLSSALDGFSFERPEPWTAVEAGLVHASFPWHGGAWDECMNSPKNCRTRSAKLGSAEMDRYKSKQISVKNRS